MKQRRRRRRIEHNKSSFRRACMNTLLGRMLVLFISIGLMVVANLYMWKYVLGGSTVVRRCPGILDNTDIVGNDYFEVYGVESENKCCEKCLSDMICNAWTFVSRVSTCYLKSVRGKPETRLDVHATSAIFHDREIGVSDKRQHQQPFDTSTSGKTNIYSDEIFNRVLKMYETYRQESESMYVSWRLTSKNEVLCMDDLGHRDDHKAIGLYPCHSHAVLGGSQSFLKSHENVFMAAGKGGKYRCLEAISNNVVFETCSSSSSSSSSEERFQFRYDSKHERIVHQKTGRCLGRTEHDLVLLSCDELVDQKWQRFELIQDKSNKQGQVANPNLVEYGFNKKRTIQIGASRVVPDKRPETCLDRDYYDEHITHHLPDTSIIICFVNEEFFALMRTISSALHASPRYLIREVILVDDGSDVPWLLEPLEQYLEKTYPKGFVKVIRNGKRLGLIKSRLVGASHAQGDVLTFLDSHVEATKGWLEPLLRSIQNNRKTAAVPVIPAVTWQNLEFGSVTSRSVGTFDWTLTFTWEPYKGPTLKPHEPLPCPVMAGGLFSIDRKYFYELGSYDEEMRIWGGENLEISFRLWTCGGNIIIHPCSIVYHIFRSKAGTVSKRQGKDTTGTLIRNNRRVLEVWMDDYKEIYYINNPKARRVEYGDVSKRLELRKKLGCESFDWYLKRMLPNMVIPSKDKCFARGSLHIETKNNNKKMCVDNLGNKRGGSIGVWPCHNQGGNQAFYLSSQTNEFRAFSHGMCIGMKGNELFSHSCNDNDKWRYELIPGRMIHLKTGLCLTFTEVPKSSIIMSECGKGQEKQQKWVWSWVK